MTSRLLKPPARQWESVQSGASQCSTHMAAPAEHDSAVDFTLNQVVVLHLSDGQIQAQKLFAHLLCARVLPLAILCYLVHVSSPCPGAQKKSV